MPREAYAPKEQEEVYAVIRKLSKKIGEEIPENLFPRVIVTEDTPLNTKGVYINGYNILVLRPGLTKKEKIDTIGEEASHFIRDYFLNKNNLSKPQKERDLPERPKLERGYAEKLIEYSKELAGRRKGIKQKYVHEFFGELGKNIAREIYGLPPSKEAIERYPKKRETLKKIRKASQKLKQYFKKHEEENFERYFDEGVADEMLKNEKLLEEIYKARSSILLHARPQKFADEINLSNINLKKLYNMTDEEVMKRFFRKDKNLSGLEKTLIGSSLGLIISGALIYKRILGYAVHPAEASQPVGLSIAFIGLLILLSYILFFRN